MTVHPDYYTPSANELFDAADIFVKFVNDKNIRSIVAVARGGIIIGELIARRTGIPCYHINYSSKAGNGDDKNHDNAWFALDAQYPALIFDEISDSNLTLKELDENYANVRVPVYTGVLYHKQHSPAVYTPDIFWRGLTPDDPWVNFPWE